MDYFDCDYFRNTYFDTPDDCEQVPPVLVAGHHAVGYPQRPELDEAEEFLAVL